MTPRTLTPTEQAILRPLAEHRAALLREIRATERGIAAVAQAFHGEPDPSVALNLETMTLTVARTPEQAAAEVQELIEREGAEHA